MSQKHKENKVSYKMLCDFVRLYDLLPPTGQHYFFLHIKWEDVEVRVVNDIASIQFYHNCF